MGIQSIVATGTVYPGYAGNLPVSVTALLQGIISTYDLQNETTLDADIGNLVANVAVAGTGLYTNAQLATFATSLYQAYNRTLTLSANPVQPAVATVAINASDFGERDLVLNILKTNAVNNQYATLGTTGAGSGPVPYYVVGSPFNAYVAQKAGTATTTPVQPGVVSVQADAIDTSTGSVTIQHVYGGKLNVGLEGAALTSATPAPFVGGVVQLAGRPQNDASTLSVSMAATQVSMTMVDPQAAAFASAPYYAEQPLTGANFSILCDYVGSTQCNLPTSAITSVSGSNVTVAFTSYNAFGTGISGLETCTGLDCFPIVSGATNTVRAPFYDAGNNLNYYHWTASGSGVTSVSAVSGGYQVTYSGGLSGAIQTSTPAYFYPQQDIQIHSNAPEGTLWTIFLTCSGSTTSSTAVQQTAGYADAYVMNIGSASQCSTTKVSYQLPAGFAASGSLTISSFGIQPFAFL